MSTIGNVLFKAENFNDIAKKYCEKVQENTASKSQENKIVEKKGGNRIPNPEQNERTLKSRFWQALVNNVEGFQDAANSFISSGKSKIYKDYVLSLIEDLYKSCGEEFSPKLRDRFDQKIRKYWINADETVDNGGVDSGKLMWVDLFSALNNRFNVFEDDVRIFSETPTAFYSTSMANLAFEIGWENDVFLYARNPKQLVIYCAIIKKKTSNWVKKFIERVEPFFKGCNSSRADRFTATIMFDIQNILQGETWENSIVDYIKRNINSFDGGSLLDSDYETTAESNLITQKLYDEIYKELGVLKTEVRICDLDISLDKNSLLFRKLFYLETNDEKKNKRTNDEIKNRKNLLVFGNEEEFSDDIAYLRKLFIIIAIEKSLANDLADNYKEVIFEINDTLVQVGVRPIYENIDGFERDVFDWYIIERLKQG